MAGGPKRTAARRQSRRARPLLRRPRGEESEINDRIDTAYRTKYGRYGGAYVNPMVAARSTTLRLVPR
ncbi:DUF2255 family protein [Streptomyces sp. NPDC001848]|uniref:DUF2255 family protein n=1 Tax=Streptomyces sp. NPDC001848 TaxID=3364618 RepID=UPI0036C6DE37